MAIPHQVNGPITEALQPPLWSQVEGVLDRLSRVNRRVLELEQQASAFQVQVSALTGLPLGHRRFVQVVGEPRDYPPSRPG